MDEDQNQQPPTNQPNYDFIMKPEQENGQPSDPGAQPQKPGFHLSKPILFGGIAIFVVLIVLAIAAVFSSSNTTSTNHSSVSVTKVKEFLSNIENNQNQAAYELLNDNAQDGFETFENETAANLKSVARLDTCTIEDSKTSVLKFTDVTLVCKPTDQLNQAQQIKLKFEVLIVADQYKISGFGVGL